MSMNKPDTPSRSLRFEDYRRWSSRLYELADEAIPRSSFLEQALRLTLELVKCDAVRAVLLTPHRRFYCAIDRVDPERFVYEALSRTEIQESRGLWSTGDDISWERLCADIYAGNAETHVPPFAEHAGYYVADIESIPELRTAGGHVGSGRGLALPASRRSFAIIPVEGAKICVGLIELESDRTGFFSTSQAAVYERIAETLGVAVERRRTQVALRERVKELTCLYGITRLVARANSSLDELLQSVADLLPPAWLYPDVAAAEIRFDDRVYSTPGAEKIVQKLTADIIVDGSKRGSVEVGYTVEKARIDEGPFLSEERNLIDTIANELSFIIEQRLYNEEKTKLRDQLRHADRLATIGQLAAGVAHELNEPLSNILGFAQLVAKDEGISEQSSKDIEKIVAGTLHARQIIRELLIFARETAPVKVTFNLNELINDGLFFLESRFKKVGIDLECRLAPNLPRVKADRLQILQVLTNLVVNAVQAMPGGGNLMIGTSLTDGHIELSVRDTGMGIDEEIIDKIFDPFFTTKDVSDGTGLGLSVVHGIVRAHQGEITVTSRRGKGSEFIVSLPVETSNGESGY